MPARTNEEARFLKLVEAHRARLVGIAHGFAGDADAGDLFHEMLLQIRKDLPAAADRSSRNLWVYRTALNTALTYQRNEAQPDTAEPAPVRGELEILRRFLAERNGVDRAILLMYLDDLSYQEMAAVTGLSVSHVGVKVHQVRQAYLDRSVTSSMVDLDRAREIWSRLEIEGEPHSAVELADQVQRRMRARRRKVVLRDTLEAGSAMLVTLLFVSAARYGELLMQIGAAVVIAAAALIVIVLHSVRRRSVAQIDSTVKLRVVGELKAVERQIRLLRNVIYWYVGPLFVGGLMFGTGLATAVPGAAGLDAATVRGLVTILQLALLVGVGALIVRLNRAAVRRRLEPLRQKLAESVEALSN